MKQPRFEYQSVLPDTAVQQKRDRGAVSPACMIWRTGAENLFEFSFPGGLSTSFRTLRMRSTVWPYLSTSTHWVNFQRAQIQSRQIKFSSSQEYQSTLLPQSASKRQTRTKFLYINSCCCAAESSKQLRCHQQFAVAGTPTWIDVHSSKKSSCNKNLSNEVRGFTQTSRAGHVF